MLLDSIEANDLWLVHGLAVAKPQCAALVASVAAVVGCAEHGDALVPVLQAHSVILNLMRPHQEVKLVLLEEAVGCILGKGIPTSTTSSEIVSTPPRVCNK
jgi:hypothetical protein